MIRVLFVDVCGGLKITVLRLHDEVFVTRFVNVEGMVVLIEFEARK